VVLLPSDLGGGAFLTHCRRFMPRCGAGPWWDSSCRVYDLGDLLMHPGQTDHGGAQANRLGSSRRSGGPRNDEAMKRHHP